MSRDNCCRSARQENKATMKRIIFLLLALSLTANGWMLIRRGGDAATVETPAVASAAPVARVTPADASLDAAASRLTKLDSADPAELRDALRAAGFDEPSVRAVIGGALRARHRAQVSQWRIERLRNAWWLGGASAPGGPPAPAQREHVLEPMRALFGRDPLDLADAEARYDFLPEAKRRLLALIDLDYNELRARAPRAAQTAAATKAERDEAELLARERRNDVLAALTPEERAEYELRFGGTAAQSARRFAAMQVTEREFRAVKPFIDAHREAAAALPSQAAPSRRAELEQRTMDSLVSAIGYDRTLDYVWSMHGGYRDAADLLREHQLPEANAARLYQLAAETGAQATAIHADAERSAERKRAELLALQQSIRPQFEALVPPALQPKLPAAARDWFALLGEGSYKVFRPVLVGAAYSESIPLRITAPARGLALPVGALPRAKP